MRGAIQITLAFHAIASLQALNIHLNEKKSEEQWGTELEAYGGIALGAGFGAELSSGEYTSMKSQFKAKVNNDHMLVRTRRGKKKPLVYLHVHKSLGSWACAMEKAHGATTPGPNCVSKNDSPWHYNNFQYYDLENTCEARTNWNNANNYTFEMIERQIEFDGGDVCSSTMNTAIIFRNPIARIRSQMTANKQMWDSVQNWLQNPNDLTHPHSWMQTHIGYDNFYIRTFLGRGFFLGSGKITREHLKLAKMNLAKVDVVIDSADLMTQVVQLEAITGFTHLQQWTAHQVHNDMCPAHDNYETMSPECKPYFLNEEGKQMLEKRNALDLEFYEYAKELAKMKMEALTQRASLYKQQETANGALLALLHGTKSDKFIPRSEYSKHKDLWQDRHGHNSTKAVKQSRTAPPAAQLQEVQREVDPDEQSTLGNAVEERENS